MIVVGVRGDGDFENDDCGFGGGGDGGCVLFRKEKKKPVFSPDRQDRVSQKPQSSSPGLRQNHTERSVVWLQLLGGVVVVVVMTGHCFCDVAWWLW